MAFSEEFYVDIRGEQRGPYTFPQVKRMYENNLIPEEALYWQDGMEHWLSVADLCGSQRRERLRRWRNIRFVGMVCIGAAALLIGYCAPILKDGWREMDERDYTTEAAYWKARGFVREDLKAHGANVAFGGQETAGVTLTGGTAATVVLPGTCYPMEGSSSKMTWKVSMEYNGARREWKLPGGGLQ